MKAACIILTIIFAFSAHLKAQVIIAPSDYDFPHIEPLKAAVATSFIGTPNGTWAEVRIPLKKRKIEGLRAWSRARFRYLWPKEEIDRKELVYVLAGFGGDEEDPKPNFFARKLADKGYHAIVLPSVFTKRFVVSTSSEGVVGESARDAQDYFKLMGEATRYIETTRSIQFQKKHLVGYSYGGLTAAFVARIDKSKKFFNLEKEILINPPSNLFASVGTLDHYYQSRRNMGELAFAKLFFRVGAPSVYFRRFIPNERIYSAYLNKIPMNIEQAKALVGTGLKSGLPSVARAIYKITEHEERDFGEVPPDWGDEFDFAQYLEETLLPFNRKFHFPDDTLDSINQRNSIYTLENYFRTNPNVYLIHNADDFLFRPGDVEFYSRAFGDRFILYPWGGHMGNMWFEQNVNSLIALIKDQPSWF